MDGFERDSWDPRRVRPARQRYDAAKWDIATLVDDDELARSLKRDLEEIRELPEAVPAR